MRSMERSEWADPMDVELELHPPRRQRRPRASATRARRVQRQTPLMPALTLLAASVAATLSVVDITTDDVGNRPVPVIVPPVEAEPAADQDDPQPTVTIATRRPLPQYNPYIPPIGGAGTWVDECLNPPVGRPQLVPC